MRANHVFPVLEKRYVICQWREYSRNASEVFAVGSSLLLVTCAKALWLVGSGPRVLGNRVRLEERNESRNFLYTVSHNSVSFVFHLTTYAVYKDMKCERN